jgi:hypothetical protein
MHLFRAALPRPPHIVCCESQQQCIGPAQQRASNEVLYCHVCKNLAQHAYPCTVSSLLGTFSTTSCCTNSTGIDFIRIASSALLRWCLPFRSAVCMACFIVVSSVSRFVLISSGAERAMRTLSSLSMCRQMSMARYSFFFALALVLTSLPLHAD